MSLVHRSDKPEAVKITEEGGVRKFARIIAAAFANDPYHRYAYLDKDSRPDHPKLSKEQFDDQVQYWLQYILLLWQKGEGVCLYQIHNWAGVAMWSPPDMYKPTRQDVVDYPEPIREYFSKLGEAKTRALGNRNYWELTLLARTPGRTERHVVSELIRPIVAQAQEQNIPVWLEATTQKARDIYVHFKFQQTEVVKIGEGVVNSEGWVEGDREGISIYPMAIGPERLGSKQ